ncbi:SRPBCC family protein [Allosaccharopolyspora coralli]|nr:SRPBCC family protein [Allosaccharopolyspora coralli]
MQHNFSVGVPIDVAWSALLDPERVAPCMPGAKLTKSEGHEFAGSVKVKLGPISLQYKGTGSFTEVDETARRVVIDASGKDARGAGTAAATVTAALTDHGEATAVRVDTDLKVTGKPAQLGRGLISEVGGRILDQFASCLADRLAGEQSGAREAIEPTAAAAASTGAASSGKTASDRVADNGSVDGEEAAAAARHPSRSTGGRPGWRVTQPEGTEVGHTEVVAADTVDETGTSGSGQQEPQPPRYQEPVAPAPEAPSTDPIDLLDTAGYPVLKRAAPIVAGVLAVVLLRSLVRRRKRRRVEACGG